MIRVEIMGGLGNQIYQYVVAYYIAKKRNRNERIYLDISRFENHHNRRFQLQYFHLPFEIYHADYHQIKEEEFIEEREYQDITNIDFSQYGEHIFIRGYFINYAHIQEIQDELIELFISRAGEEYPSMMFFDKLYQIQHSNSVAVHIRHGDYFKDTHAVHGILSTRYYRQAIEDIQKKISNAKFYFFSDNIDYVRKEFLDIAYAEYVEISHAERDLLEFELMRHARHNIIANSTFSQLAAILGYYQKNKIVYAPRIYVLGEEGSYTYRSEKFLDTRWHYLDGKKMFMNEKEREKTARLYPRQEEL